MEDGFEQLVAYGGEPGDRKATLKHIASVARTMFSANTCVLFPFNPITGKFEGNPTVDTDSPIDEGDLEQPLHEGIATYVLGNGELFVGDVSKQDTYESPFTRTYDFCAYAAIVLRTARRKLPLAVLYLDFHEVHLFDEGIQNALRIFGKRASFLLQRAWLLSRYKEVELIGQDINSNIGAMEFPFDALVRRISNIIDISHVFLLGIYKTESDKLDLYSVVKGEKQVRENVSITGDSRLVIQRRHHLFIRAQEDAREGMPEHLPGIPGGQKSLIYVPLWIRSTSLGILSVQNPKPDAYSHEDLVILQLLGYYVALALSNMRLLLDVQQLTSTGQLLTQKLQSQGLPQLIVEQIQRDTKAKAVVLYPFDPERNAFISAQFSAGEKMQIGTVEQNLVDSVLAQGKPSWAIDETESTASFVGSTRQKGLEAVAVLPLLVGNTSVGVLLLKFDQRTKFNSPQKRLFEGLATYAAISIKNARLFGILAERHAITQSIDRLLTQTPNLEELLRAILQLGAEHVNSQDAAIMLFDPKTRTITTEVAVGPHADVKRKESMSKRKKKGVTWWVLEHKIPALVGNVSDPQWRKIHAPIIPGTVSKLAVPVLDGEDVVAVISFESKQPLAFSEEDKEFIYELAQQVVLAIKQAQSFEEVSASSRRFELLSEAGEELGKISNYDERYNAFTIVVNKVEKHNGGHVVVRLLNAAEQVLECVCHSKRRGIVVEQKWEIDRGVHGYLLSNNLRTVFVPDVMNPEPGIRPDPADRKSRSLVITKIEVGDHYYGNLVLAHRKANYFQKADEHLFEGLAKQLAITLRRLEVTIAQMEEERTRKELEIHIKEAELMTSVGASASELVHRLGQDLGLVPRSVSIIRKQLVQRGVPDVASVKELAYIRKQVKRVRGLAAELKQSLTQLHDLEESSSAPVSIPAEQLLYEALDSIHTIIPSNVRVQFDIRPGIPFINVRDRLIVYALRNLMVNAVEAIKKRRKKRPEYLTLSAYSAELMVILEVRDTGVGIDQKRMEKIYYLWHSSKGSLGFGLWSARWNVLRNGGDLVGESRLGEGSTFRISLPAV